jgi:ABC-2 type transport system permease protein
MKTIFLKELKLTRKSLIIWCGVLLVTIFYGLVEYPMVAQNADMIMESMRMLPRVVIIMFGLEGIGLKTSIDYHLTLLYWVALMAYVHAVVTGVTVLARDERDRTAEFIYVKPFKRSDIVTAKVLTGLAGITILAGVTWIGSAATVYYIEGTLRAVLDGRSVLGTVSATILGMWLTQIVFFGVGLLMAGRFRTHRKALRFCLIFVILTYILSIVIQLSGSMDYLRVLSPFSYFSGLSVATGGLEILFVILAILITAGSLYGSYRSFQRKDLSI